MSISHDWLHNKKHEVWHLISFGCGEYGDWSADYLVTCTKCDNVDFRRRAFLNVAHWGFMEMGHNRADAFKIAFEYMGD